MFLSVLVSNADVACNNHINASDGIAKGIGKS